MLIGFTHTFQRGGCLDQKCEISHFLFILNENLPISHLVSVVENDDDWRMDFGLDNMQKNTDHNNMYCGNEHKFVELGVQKF